MEANASIQFFEDQFQRQVSEADLRLNPFEETALPFVRGKVLDYGCGLGNLAIAAARSGCHVTALDGSTTAVAHINDVAARENLPVQAQIADLRSHLPEGEFDCVIAIGLLMFFDCDTAGKQLSALMSALRPGGVIVLNVLIEGTTFLDMFDKEVGFCLFDPRELTERFAGWHLELKEVSTFAAPRETLKRFLTVVARKPRLQRLGPDHGSLSGARKSPRIRH